MKQILTILVLFFLFSGNAFAFDVCEHEKKYSQIWYGNNCDNNLLQSTDQKFKKKQGSCSTFSTIFGEIPTKFHQNLNKF